jgi:hypothetical protein
MTARQARTIITLALLVVPVMVTSCAEVIGWRRPRRWEYLITVPNDAEFDREMDRLGAQSWELVTVQRAAAGVVASNECIFKRPKRGP